MVWMLTQHNGCLRSSGLHQAHAPTPTGLKFGDQVHNASRLVLRSMTLFFSALMIPEIQMHSKKMPISAGLSQLRLLSRCAKSCIEFFKQYWRTPSYLYSKLALCLISSLFIGFVFFDAATTQRGLQNQMFSIFVHLTIFQQLSQQIMPHFVTQRSLYEARE